MTALDTVLAASVSAVKRSGALEAGALMATVSVVNANGTVSVTRNGDTYPSVRLLRGDPTPAVGALVEILKTSGGWVCLGSLVTAQPPAGTILDHRVGRTNVLAAGGAVPVSAAVTFSPPLRTGTTVIITATPQTTAPGTVVTGVGISAQTVSGFTLWLTRTGAATDTFAHWNAYSIS